jgi:hypothetical protein
MSMQYTLQLQFCLPQNFDVLFWVMYRNVGRTFWIELMRFRACPAIGVTLCVQPGVMSCGGRVTLCVQTAVMS